VIHVLQNRNQKGMYVHVCAASILDEGMCTASLAARLIRLGVWKGVDRRTSSFHLKNHAY